MEINGISASRCPQSIRDTMAKEEDIELLTNLFQEILQAILNNQYSWPFLHPVSSDEAPDYHEVIKDPIDLETIGNRLNEGQYYITKDIFFADLRRMCENCKVYNKEGTVYFTCAAQIEKLLRERAGADYFK